MAEKTVKLLRLFDLLQRPPDHSVAELAALLDVSSRTIYRYLGVLRASGFAVDSDHAGVRLAAPAPVSPPLSEAEIFSLLLSQRFAPPLPAERLQQHRLTCAAKLFAMLSREAQERAAHALRSSHARFRPAKSEDRRTVENVFSAALEAAESGAAATLLLDSSGSLTQCPQAIENLQIAFRRGRWLIVGRSAATGQRVAVALERIVSLSVTRPAADLPENVEQPGRSTDAAHAQIDEPHFPTSKPSALTAPRAGSLPRRPPQA